MITGAGSGLGLALAQVAASRGAHVVGVVRKLQHLAILKGEINNNCSPVMADINHPNAEQTISEHLDLLGRPLDLLVNCAGIPGAGAVLAETNLQSVEDLFRVHCIGALRCTRAAVKWLAVSPKPVVINISSRLGSINGVAAGLFTSERHSYAYRIAKAAQNMATACLHSELSAIGIAVIAINPGKLNTSLSEHVDGLPPKNAAAIILSLVRDLTPAMWGTFRDLENHQCQW